MKETIVSCKQGVSRYAKDVDKNDELITIGHKKRSRDSCYAVRLVKQQLRMGIRINQRNECSLITTTLLSMKRFIGNA